MKRKLTSILKPFIFALAVAFVALTISPLIAAGVTGKQDAPKAEAFEDGYRVRVEIQTNSYTLENYLTEAEIWIHTKKDQGRGENHYWYSRTENIAENIKEDYSIYSTTVNCGKEFPYCITLYTKHGGQDIAWVSYDVSFIVYVYVNDVRVAYNNVRDNGTIFPDYIADFNSGKENEIWVPEDNYPHYESNSADQYGVYWSAPAIKYETNYRIKVNIKITDDADDWNSAYIWIHTRPNNGRDDVHWFYHSSGDIKSYIDYTGANYTYSTIKTGTEFPHWVSIKTDIGSFAQYHYGEADVTVYINDINVASRHISFGGWGRCDDENAITIDETKFPHPKEWNMNYSANVDPSEEDTTILTMTPVDQYGVLWAANASYPISVTNRSWPGEDVAEKLDEGGYKWKLSSSKADNHFTNYYFYVSTGSTVYPTREEKVQVKFIFPLHLYIKLDGEVVYSTIGYMNDTVEIPDIDTPVGYVIDSYKRDSGVGAIEKNEDGKYTYTFTGDTSTFIAKTKAIAYTVKYDPNIAEGDTLTGRMLDKTANYGKSFALATNQFKRAGYTFTGWNTAPDGSGKAYSKQEKVSNLASEKGAVVTLYAQWEENPDASITASLFTEGNLGLMIGGMVVEVAAIIIIVSIIAKKRRRA